jgi:apolipoprotein N-acyltransferase
MSFLHFPNCSMPDWYYALLLSVSTLGLIYALFRAKAAHDASKNIQVLFMVVLFTLVCVINWLGSLAMLVQGGMFEAGLLLFVLDLICALVCSTAFYSSCSSPFMHLRRSPWSLPLDGPTFRGRFQDAS